MKLSIIVPAYNEEKTIKEILTKVDKLDLEGITKEIIVIDDGSKDGTLKAIKEASSLIKDLIILSNRKNHGKGVAVTSGIKRASGDIIIIQDADLEYNPSDIPRLIRPILENKASVAYGTRLKSSPVFFGKNKTPLLPHFFGNKFLSYITSMLYGYSISDMETGYKAFSKKVFEGIRIKAKSFDFEPEITAKILKRKIRIHEIEIKTKPRNYNEGKKLYAVKDGPKALWTLIKYRFTD